MKWHAEVLPRTYFPRHAQNRMRSEGDLWRARAEYLSGRHKNLRHLLANRYKWMNGFINYTDLVVEIGTGFGISQDFIKINMIKTDIIQCPWIDVCMDGLNLPFGADAIDVIICTNVLHHFSSPIQFLIGVQRCLKPGGHILLFEPNPSFLLLLALRMMRHEGWSFEVDVFDPTALASDPTDPWAGNNAVSDLMFRDRSLFEENLRGFEIVQDSFSECLMFPLSGGVTAKIKTF
ncbi:MAG: methyltransferase domain-containing protein [Stellaceae bacterium]